MVMQIGSLTVRYKPKDVLVSVVFFNKYSVVGRLTVRGVTLMNEVCSDRIKSRKKKKTSQRPPSGHRVDMTFKLSEVTGRVNIRLFIFPSSEPSRTFCSRLMEKMASRNK